MILVVLAVAGLGCTTREERLATWREQCSRDYGFASGTEAHSNCVMQHDIAHTQSARAAAMAVATRPVPVPTPAPAYVPPMVSPR